MSNNHKMKVTDIIHQYFDQYTENFVVDNIFLVEQYIIIIGFNLEKEGRDIASVSLICKEIRIVLVLLCVV